MDKIEEIAERNLRTMTLPVRGGLTHLILDGGTHINFIYDSVGNIAFPAAEELARAIYNPKVSLGHCRISEDRTDIHSWSLYPSGYFETQAGSKKASPEAEKAIDLSFILYKQTLKS